MVKKVRNVTVALTGLEAKGEIGRLAAKSKSRLGARKRGRYEREVLSGNEYSADGHFMRKERIIDRRNDRYIETVINEDTGEVVRQIDEPLSRHVGRGTERRTKK